jgi:DNA-binding transcriptional ArsR family regulator
MVTEPARNLTVFGAVADPTRRAILDLLRRGDFCDSRARRSRGATRSTRPRCAKWTGG